MTEAGREIPLTAGQAEPSVSGGPRHAAGTGTAGIGGGAEMTSLLKAYPGHLAPAG